MCARNASCNWIATAELLSTLPELKAMMADEEAAGIQESSEEVWRSGDAEIFAMADWTGKIVALHTTGTWIFRGPLRRSDGPFARFPAGQAAGGLGRVTYIRWRCAPFRWAVRLRKCIWAR